MKNHKNSDKRFLTHNRCSGISKLSSHTIQKTWCKLKRTKVIQTACIELVINNVLNVCRGNV